MMISGISVVFLLVFAAEYHCDINSEDMLNELIEKKLRTVLEENSNHHEEEIETLKQQQKAENEILKQVLQEVEKTLKASIEDTVRLRQKQKEQQNEIHDLRILSNFLLEKLKQQRKEDPISNSIKENKRLLLDDPSHLQFEIDQLKASVSAITSTKGGAIYVRWGKTTCQNNDTEIVYSGYAGGSYYTQPGAAAEYVCLPQDPIYGIQIPESISDTAFIYGAEYETGYFGPAQNQDVPCVVCRSLTGTTALMIPARNKCYSGWKPEYFGHLASGRYDHAAATQFVCVDSQPDVIVGRTADDNGKLFYPVRSRCGSLKCPPYENDKELLCVVCTR